MYKWKQARTDRKITSFKLLMKFTCFTFLEASVCILYAVCNHIIIWDQWWCAQPWGFNHHHTGDSTMGWNGIFRCRTKPYVSFSIVHEMMIPNWLMFLEWVKYFWNLLGVGCAKWFHWCDSSSKLSHGLICRIRWFLCALNITPAWSTIPWQPLHRCRVSDSSRPRDELSSCCFLCSSYWVGHQTMYLPRVKLA